MLFSKEDPDIQATQNLSDPEDYEYEYPTEEELDAESQQLIPPESGVAERRRQIQEDAEREELLRHKLTQEERNRASGLIPPGQLNLPQDRIRKK